MNIDKEFITQNNARILSGFSFQQRYRPFHNEKKENAKEHDGEIRLSADERRFLLCIWSYQYKSTLTEIYSSIGFSASKGTRIAKKLEREYLIKIFNIVKGKGVSKYPVLLSDSYTALNVEEKKFEGKGCGYEHLIWQHILAGHFRGYKAVIELNRGNKCIDVAFEYEGRLIAVEVAISSAHEKANIEKDIQMARASLVIIGGRDEKVLDEVNSIIKELDGNFKDKAKAFLLSRILTLDLDGLVKR